MLCFVSINKLIFNLPLFKMHIKNNGEEFYLPWPLLSLRMKYCVTNLKPNMSRVFIGK